MQRNKVSWSSPSLGSKMELQVFGEEGTPVIVFPTEDGANTEWEEYGMVNALSHQLKNRYNQLFCVDTVDDESLMNNTIDPRARLLRQRQFEAYIVDELVPFVKKQNSSSFLITAGARMGGYHAANLAFKYPDTFNKVISMNGLYDIKPLFHGFFDDDVYYNSPVDYLSLMNDHSLLDKIQQLDLRILVGDDPSAARQAEQLREVMRRSSPDFSVDQRDEAQNEWKFYQQVIKEHIV